MTRSSGCAAPVDRARRATPSCVADAARLRALRARREPPDRGDERAHGRTRITDAAGPPGLDPAGPRRAGRRRWRPGWPPAGTPTSQVHAFRAAAAACSAGTRRTRTCSSCDGRIADRGRRSTRTTPRRYRLDELRRDRLARGRRRPPALARRLLARARPAASHASFTVVDGVDPDGARRSRSAAGSPASRVDRTPSGPGGVRPPPGRRARASRAAAGGRASRTTTRSPGARSSSPRPTRRCRPAGRSWSRGTVRRHRRARRAADAPRP